MADAPLPGPDVTAECVRIVDADGQARLALHNASRMPAIRLDGVDYPGMRQGGAQAGLMFYDGQGNECGGLVFGAATGADGRRRQDLGLAFDAFGQDQVVHLFSQDVDGERRCGLRLTDRPARPLRRDIAAIEAARALPPGPERDRALAAAAEGHADRVLLGREPDAGVHLTLCDRAGRPRLRLSVDATDQARVEFLDAAGRVVYSLAPPEGAGGGG